MMITNYNIKYFLYLYPKFKLKFNDDSKTIIEGIVTLDNTFNEVRFYKQYHVIITLKQNIVPYIQEINHYLKNDYSHRYSDGGLCLGTDTEILIKCFNNNKFNLITWYKNYVLPYFFSYEYYERFGIYPFGERSHGCLGILEFYNEFFGLNTLEKVLNCMNFAAHYKYRGHHPCPCGSGKKIRDCHKNELWKSCQPPMRKFIELDLKSIIQEVNSYK